tara:strand:+ start:797 stop:1114 length:318 start_codon:yes stop_codon:yes gene_type:complete
MAITANMTTHDGIELTDVYVRVTQAYVKNMPDDEGTDAWKLVYDVLIYKDKDTRDDKHKEQSMRIKNNHVDHFKIDYSLDATDNPIKLAYADLKANSQLSNVKDV